MERWEEYEIYCGTRGWNEDVFNEARALKEEEMLFLKETVQPEEGLPCKRCGGTKTYTHQKQVRAADEGTTSFTYCFSCKTQTVE